MSEADLRRAIWAILDEPSSSPEEKLQAVRGFLRLTGEPQGYDLRLTQRTDGRVEIWLAEGRSTKEVAERLREIADGFENDPWRVG